MSDIAGAAVYVPPHGNLTWWEHQCYDCLNRDLAEGQTDLCDREDKRILFCLDLLWIVLQYSKSCILFEPKLKDENNSFLCGQTHTSDMDPDKDQNQTSYEITNLPRPTVNVCRVQAVQSLTGSRRLSSESCGNIRES